MLADATIINATPKDSHFCHWQRIALPEAFTGLLIKGNPNAKLRYYPWENWGMSMGLLPGWDQIEVIKPVKNNPDEKFNWRIMYKGINGGGVVDRLSLVFDQDSEIKLFIGPGDWLAFAEKMDGKEVPLASLGRFSRYDPTVPGRQI